MGPEYKFILKLYDRYYFVLANSIVKVMGVWHYTK